MAETTGISWATSTWNCWMGCTKVSPGCASCFMHRDMARYGRDPETVVRARPATFNAPLKWREPKRIFTCSWSDFFHEDADEWRDDAWEIVRHAPRHTYLILTKRPERIADHLPHDWGDGWPQVWLGVSAENQRFADQRIPILLGIPAALRFVSAEPLLSALNLEPYMHLPGCRQIGCVDRGLDWLICGGESGGRPGHPPRPMHLDWARSLRDQAVRHGIPFHLKQLGGLRPGGPALLDGREWREMPDG